MSTSSILLDTFDPDYTHDAALTLPLKPDGALCPDCREVKEIGMFKRYASLAQTRCWLRNPHAKRRLQYEGRECNACFKKNSRKADDMSPAELEKRLYNEGTHPLILENVVHDRKMEGKRKRRENMVRNNRTRFAERYDTSLKKLEAFRQAVYRVRTSPKLKNMAGMIPTLEAFLDNADSAISMAKQEVKDLRREGKAPPIDWRELLPDRRRSEATLLYRKVSMSYQRLIHKLMDCMPLPEYEVQQHLPPSLAFMEVKKEKPLDLSWLEEMMGGKT